MATRRYGVSRGKLQSMADNAVTEAVGAATAANHCELTFDLAVGLTKQEVLMAIKRIQAHIVRGNWPPA